MSINNLKLTSIDSIISKANTIQSVKSFNSISYEDTENSNTIISHKLTKSHLEPRKTFFSSKGIKIIKPEIKINNLKKKSLITHSNKLIRPNSINYNKNNKRLSNIKPFYPKKVSGININFLKKQIKCERLKNEIILNHQVKFYSPKNYFETFREVPIHNFIRKNIKSRNIYSPSYPYDKNDIFNKENPIKYGFKTEYTSERNENNNNSNNKNNHKTINTFRKIVKKINNINFDIYKKNEELTKEIFKRNKKNKRDEKLKMKKKEVFKLEKSYSKKKHKSYTINIDKLMDDNAKKVKLKLEPKIHKYLNNVINQIKYEDRFKNENIDDNSEYSIKNRILKFEKDFKYVAFENMKWKSKLNLKQFHEKEKENEVNKMKRYVNNITEQWENEDFLKYEILRSNIVKNFQPLLPTPITKVKVKKLCEIIKEV